MSTFEVHGSHGMLVVDAQTGEIVDRAYEPGCPCDDNCYARILLFDVDEWKRTYPGENPAEAGEVDVLDLGFWHNDETVPEGIGKYEPPDQDWRKLYAEIKAGR